MTTVPFRWSNQSAVSSDHRHHQGNVLVGLRNTQTSQRPRWPWDRVTWSPVFPILKHNFVVVVLVVLEMLIFIYSFIYLFLLLSYMSLNAQTQDVDTKIQTNSCWNTEPPYMQRLPKFVSWALICAFTCFTFLLFFYCLSRLLHFISPLYSLQIFLCLDMLLLVCMRVHTLLVSARVPQCVITGEREKLVFFKEHPQN